MKIGWYVHHHGAGHLHRLLAVRDRLPEVVGIGSGPHPGDVPWVDLPLDTGGPIDDPTASDTLHWAPRGHPGLRARMAQLAAWIDEAEPQVLVVDVSVEVALLGRLLGVPTVLVVQRGWRVDAAHQLAYRQASAVVAPWTEATHLAGEGPPDERVELVGAISRFDGRAFAAAEPGGDVLVLFGSGGSEVGRAEIEAAAAATPGRRWHVAGVEGPMGENVVAHGDADVGALLDACSVVVGSAGGNVIAEVAAARRPFVCVPQQRPFGEQERQGVALGQLGVAEVRERWPEAGDWPALLDRAEGVDLSRWDLLHDGRGAARLAEVVERVARAA